MSQFDFKGTYTALITPFSNGEVDYSSLERLVKLQMEGGVDGFVVNGTTAESPTLEWSEVEEIFKRIRAQVGTNFPLILGTGSNSTKKTIETTKKAEAMGADGALVVCPYYNKPTSKGMVAHFKAVAQSTGLPVILYNVPGRTVVSMKAVDVAELASVPNIVGIKEASGDIGLFKEMKDTCPNDFVFLSGDDGSSFDFVANGGHGIISVMSHIIPKKTVAWMQGKDEEGFKQSLELINGLYVEPNPIPTKWALQKMGVIGSAECRLPLHEFSSSLHSPLEKLLVQHKLI